MARQPVVQAEDARRRRERPRLGPSAASVVGQAHARGDRLLVDVEAGATFDQGVHRSLLPWPLSPGGASVSGESYLRARSDSSGCQRLQRPTYLGLAAPSRRRRHSGDRWSLALPSVRVAAGGHRKLI